MSSQAQPHRYAAVIFDLGGVVFPSPFEAFDAYDGEHDLAPGTVRALIKASSETGAWSELERGELTMTEFYARLQAEAAAAGFALDGARLMGMIGRGFGPQPEMARAITRIREEGLRTAALTNNWPNADPSAPSANGNTLGFDVIIESAVVGLRKPDPRIYEMALAELDVDANATVFLDDLGINLKPARAMGMTTIKVTDPATALNELAAVLGFEVR
jgi:putative hydrolase of the HAD superfamily